MHKQFKYHLILVFKNLSLQTFNLNFTTMSFNATFIANFSDSNNKCYKAELARRRAETEALLLEQEEKEWLERQA